ncbi:hypothetical protein E1193_07630 [Micromonospora sp. KC606]|uniref:hypothetical protein n=1 Tax=Micromonospora sp. KC606 TaxID=2530379 RepID=UPI00104AFB4C|nr:hypothetical protein [Micromonospora sp. KC606]TDC83788.1 hypothetical protein E1193_07630 [Micromonospora sp. KC606]
MNIDEMIKAARPARHPSWSEGPQAERVLRGVLADPASPRTGAPRSRWARPALVAVVGLAGVTGLAGAAVLALAPEPPPDWKVPGNSIACAAERTKDADLSIRAWRAGDDPVDTCRQDWISRTGAAPETLYSCVFMKDGSGGGVIVIPGDGIGTAAQACATVGMFVAPANLTPAPANTNIPTRPAPGGGE